MERKLEPSEKCLSVLLLYPDEIHQPISNEYFKI